jgi:YesN/AraC family two-component response regulator
MNDFVIDRISRINLKGYGLKGYGLAHFSPSSVDERIRYSTEVPYSITKQCDQNGFIRPHYSHTLEIMVSHGAEGNFLINGKSVDIRPKSIIFILPNVLHGGKLYCDEKKYLYNIKVSFRELRNLIDIENILKINNHSLDQLAYSSPDYDNVLDAIDILIKEDDNIYRRIRNVMRLFEIFENGIPKIQTIFFKHPEFNDEGLNRLIIWTQNHFREHITIDDAACFMNFSKSYFCKYFKKAAQVTYLTYLNQMRISHAINLIMSGKSAKECCYECGFENVPYFIKLFKTMTGITTSEYKSLFIGKPDNL